MFKKLFFGFLASFLLGWILSSGIYAIDSKDKMIPFSFAKVTDLISPSDHIKEDQIHVYEDYIVIDIKNASWSSFADTKSMDPVIDSGANGIEIKPKTTDDIKVGDIISYKAKFTDGLVVHRVIKTGFDEYGWYAIVKGDNNNIEDPEKVRFEQINGVLVAIIY